MWWCQRRFRPECRVHIKVKGNSTVREAALPEAIGCGISQWKFCSKRYCSHHVHPHATPHQTPATAPQTPGVFDSSSSTRRHLHWLQRKLVLYLDAAIHFCRPALLGVGGTCECFPILSSKPFSARSRAFVLGTRPRTPEGCSLKAGGRLSCHRRWNLWALDRPSRVQGRERARGRQEHRKGGGSFRDTRRGWLHLGGGSKHLSATGRDAQPRRRGGPRRPGRRNRSKASPLCLQGRRGVQVAGFRWAARPFGHRRPVGAPWLDQDCHRSSQPCVTQQQG